MRHSLAAPDRKRSAEVMTAHYGSAAPGRREVVRRALSPWVSRRKQRPRTRRWRAQDATRAPPIAIANKDASRLSHSAGACRRASHVHQRRLTRSTASGPGSQRNETGTPGVPRQDTRRRLTFPHHGLLAGETVPLATLRCRDGPAPSVTRNEGVPGSSPGVGSYESPKAGLSRLLTIARPRERGGAASPRASRISTSAGHRSASDSSAITCP